MAKRPEEPLVTPSTQSVPAPDNANISFNEQTADWQYDWQKTPFKTEDGRIVNFDRIPSGQTVDGRSVSVGEFGRNFGAGFDPRYYFASGVTPTQANILAMGGKIEGQDVSVPKFAPGDMPSQFLGDAPQPSARDRAREQMENALSDPNHPLNPHRVDPATGEPIRKKTSDPLERAIARGIVEQRASERYRAAEQELESNKYDRQVEQYQFYTDLSRQRRPDFVQRDDARAEASYFRGEDTSPTPPTGPRQTPEEAMLDIAAKGRRRDELSREKEQFDRMMTERARARRGLPPLDQEARAAAQSPEAAAAYREGPKPPQPGQAQTPQAGSQVPPTTQPDGQGGYQTGQTVALQNIPGGQESTTVYALDNNVALPGGMDMSTEDFGAAFEQLNPGKTKMDAVQALAREPGATGNAARALLRDAGAAGGQPLTPAQREQIEAQLGGRADELLREHARSMSSGIAEGSKRIQKEREAQLKMQQDLAEEQAKQEAEIRKAAITEAEKRYGTEEYAGRSYESILQESMDYQRSRSAFISGEGEAPRRPVDVQNVFDVPQYEVRPQSVPSDAMPEGAAFDASGKLIYQNEQLGTTLNAALVDAPGRAGKKQVVPIIENDRQAAMLPPGQSYMLDGKLYLRGTPGRPKKEGEETAGTTGKKTKPDEVSPAKISAQQVKDDLVRKKTRGLTSEMDVTEAEIEKLDLAAKSGGETPEITARRNELKQTLAEQKKAYEEATSVSMEEIRAEMDRRLNEASELKNLEQSFRFDQGDPEVVGTVTRGALPDSYTEQVTPSGKQINIDGVTVPYDSDENGNIVVNPSTPEQIIALEANANGNIVTKNMGDNAVSAASSNAYIETNQIRTFVLGEAEKNPALFINGTKSNQTAVIEKVSDYLIKKYNPDQNQLPRLIDSMLESFGFQSSVPQDWKQYGYDTQDKLDATANAPRSQAELDIARQQNQEANKGLIRKIGDDLNQFFGGGFSPQQ